MQRAAEELPMTMAIGETRSQHRGTIQKTWPPFSPHQVEHDLTSCIRCSSKGYDFQSSLRVYFTGEDQQLVVAKRFCRRLVQTVRSRLRLIEVP